ACATELPQSSGETVSQIKQVADVIECVLELRRRKRPVAPVGACLTSRKARGENLTNQIDKRKGVTQPDEPSRDLNVEDPLREGAGFQVADSQVLSGGMHHDFDRGIVHESPKWAKVSNGKRIDHREAVASRKLQQAQDRLERLLGNELSVESKPAS